MHVPDISQCKANELAALRDPAQKQKQHMPWCCILFLDPAVLFLPDAFQLVALFPGPDDLGNPMRKRGTRLASVRCVTCRQYIHSLETNDERRIGRDHLPVLGFEVSFPQKSPGSEEPRNDGRSHGFERTKEPRLQRNRC